MEYSFINFSLKTLVIPYYNIRRASGFRRILKNLKMKL